jgi:hypothetical protein
MKAIMMDRHGGLDVLRYGDLPDPVAETGRTPELGQKHEWWQRTDRVSSTP